MLLREDDTNYEMISSPIIHANVTRAAHTGRMRILIVSDAGAPQINGVVSTLTQTASWLNRFGHDVEQVTPAQFRSLPCPTYPEIRVALRGYRGITKRIEAFEPQFIHIATEGPLGLAARRYCREHGLRFTTSYHTQFPQYIRSRVPIPLALTFFALRWFHSAAERCLVSTQAIQNDLKSRGFIRLARWGRGVDTERFRPRDKAFLNLPRPIAAYVGRVAVEKNISAFMRMRWMGSKLVIGDGPECAKLKAAFPEVQFVGFLFDDALAQSLAAADVLVFPSRSDTFGLVMLEAMACGVPIAAYPVTGPIDVVDDGITGALDEDLRSAAIRALSIDPRACRARALRSGWDLCTREFERNLVPCAAAGTRPMHTHLRSGNAPNDILFRRAPPA
jgi:glycosyltransferase involved in cell wall biosynthesis